MESTSLSGRVALVTGANHGIGAAIARRVARSGAAVLGTYLAVHDAEDPGTPGAYRTNRAKDGSELVAAIEAEGGRVIAVEADLRDHRVVPRLFDRAEASFGPGHLRSGLSKRLEDQLPILWTDPDARVGHRKPERDAVEAASRHPDVHGDGAVLGEFNPVGDQVEKHLAQAYDVTHQLVRDVVVDVACQLEAAFAGVDAERLFDGLERLA